MPELSAPIPSWRDRWSGEPGGYVVLDLGLQPASDLFPRPDAPGPDPRYPLRMVFSTTSGLIQLEDDPTTPEEVLGIEPKAVVEQAEAAVAQAAEAGYLVAGERVFEYPSPHGGSWTAQLAERGLKSVKTDQVDVVIDNFGIMHDRDQKSALVERVSHLGPDGVLLLQYHNVAAVVRHGMWNSLKLGHYALYSTPVLVGMAEELGLVALNAWEYPLYSGTVLIAFARKGSKWGDDQGETVTAMIDRELAEGITDPAYVASLDTAVTQSVAAIDGYLTDAAAKGLRVAGYGAASRTASLLCAADITSEKMFVIADGAPGKHGLSMPVNRIPIVSPQELIDLRPDRVLLFVPDLLDEVRRSYPEIEANGGRWVLMEPAPHEVDPI
ncbi:class I SAM-dependent methyltransferase [Humibacter soli]